MASKSSPDGTQHSEPRYHHKHGVARGACEWALFLRTTVHFWALISVLLPSVRSGALYTWEKKDVFFLFPVAWVQR